MANRRLQILAIVAVTAILLLVVLVLGLRSAVIRYLESGEFRGLIGGHTGRALGGDAVFEPLQWNGTEVFSPGFLLNGNGVLTKVEAGSLRGALDWRAVFEGEWRMPRLEVARIDIAAAQAQVTAPPAVARPAAPAVPQSGGIPGWLPDRFRLESIVIGDLNLGWDGPVPARLTGTRAVVTARGENWEITGRGGSLDVAGWPSLQCVDFTGRFVPGTFYLTKSELAHGETGKIRITADIARVTTWHADWEGIDAGPWLPESWRPHLSGKIRGSARSLPDGSVAGDLTLENGMLQGLDVLDRLAKFTASPQFRKLPLSRLSGNFTLRDGGSEWRNIICESRGLMRAEGSLRIGAGGELSGVFQVGVGPQVLQWIPGSRERVFTRSAEGYLWTEVRIGGTTRDVQEDLSSRLMIAAGEEVIQRGVETLQSAPDAAREGVKGALDILAPLLR